MAGPLTLSSPSSVFDSKGAVLNFLGPEAFGPGLQDDANTDWDALYKALDDAMGVNSRLRVSSFLCTARETLGSNTVVPLSLSQSPDSSPDTSTLRAVDRSLIPKAQNQKGAESLLASLRQALYGRRSMRQRWRRRWMNCKRRWLNW